MPPSDRPRRLWLVGLIVVAVAADIAGSAVRHSRPAPVVVLGGGRLQLLEFGMGVCEQCKRMRPVMAQAAREIGDRVDVHVLDIRQEANEQLADRFGMRTIPLVILADGAGREVWRHEGYIAYPALSAAINGRLPSR
jgi:thioredoxin 1